MELGFYNAAQSNKLMTEAHKPPKATQKDQLAAPAETTAADTAPADVSVAAAAPNSSTDEPATAAPAAKAKKEKLPAIEDQPFADFVQQHLVPAIQTSLTAQGWTDLSLQFTNSPVSISGLAGIPDCWQIIGQGQQGKRQFNLYFFDENIQGQRGFSCTSDSGRTSSIESFLIDERKMTLDLLMFGLMKRLNAQQWLSGQLAAVS
jgi:Protein of unknown function (DUF2996)